MIEFTISMTSFISCLCLFFILADAIIIYPNTHSDWVGRAKSIFSFKNNLHAFRWVLFIGLLFIDSTMMIFNPRNYFEYNGIYDSTTSTCGKAYDEIDCIWVKMLDSDIFLDQAIASCALRFARESIKSQILL